jgi:FkbM family methyltransferase
MKIEKVNGFWVPSNDIHIEQWKSGQPFTQNKCLLKFLDYCESQHKKFRTVIDVGAWCGTWAKAMEPYAKKIIAFEPDATHFECLQRNCTINCTPRMEAVGSELKQVSLTEDDFTQAKRIDKEGKIKMTTLDHLDYPDIDLIKIDVEGYEMEVLKGAVQTLASVQYLMIELNNATKKYGSSNLEIEGYINSLGYKLLINHWPDKVFYRAT